MWNLANFGVNAACNVRSILMEEWVRELRELHAIRVFRFHVFEGGSSRRVILSFYNSIVNMYAFTIVRSVFESFETLKEKRDESDKEKEIRR